MKGRLQFQITLISILTTLDDKSFIIFMRILALHRLLWGVHFIIKTSATQLIFKKLHEMSKILTIVADSSILIFAIHITLFSLTF